MEKAKSHPSTENIDFNKLVKTLPVQLTKISNTQCPIHSKQVISCICLTEKCEKVILCSKCLIEDMDHYKKCASKGNVLCIEDFRSKMVEVLKTGGDVDRKGLNTKLQKLKETLIEIATQKFIAQITEKIDVIFTDLNEELNQKINNPVEEDSQGNENLPTQASEKDDEWTPMDTDFISIEKFCDEEIVQNVDIQNLGKMIRGVYHQLQNNSVVNFNTALNSLDDNFARITMEKEQISKGMEGYSRMLSSKVSSYLNSSFGIRPNRDLAICCKRFSTTNNPYHYQTNHAHNSISFKLSAPTWFYGYSAYTTREMDPQIITVKLTRGQRTQDSQLLTSFETTFPHQDDMQLTNQTVHTSSVWLESPLQLEGQVWYTISFDKPNATYIHYGSSSIRNPMTFGEEKKTVKFAKAECDQYDNTDNVGQFPDLYLY